MIRISTAFIFLFFILTFSAEGAKFPKHQFGIGGSTISGAGLSYQIDIDRKYSFRTNGFAYYFGNNPPDDLDMYFVLGGELQRNLFRQIDQRFYILLGTSHWYFEERSLYTERIGDLIIENRNSKIDRIWNFGAGAGYEKIILQRLALSLSLGFQYQISGEEQFSKFFDREGFGLAGGIGIRYMF
ncbi:MAG: hypothetical protein ACLFR2_12100 [Candidatus Kapaibacterium sp.]